MKQDNPVQFIPNQAQIRAMKEHKKKKRYKIKRQFYMMDATTKGAGRPFNPKFDSIDLILEKGLKCGTCNKFDFEVEQMGQLKGMPLGVMYGVKCPHCEGRLVVREHVIS